MLHINRIVTTGAILAALTVSASAKIERTVERSFQVQPGVHVRVSTAGGEIRISPSSEPVVRVVARERIRAGSDSEADALLQGLELTMEPQGNDVVATAVYKGAPGVHFGFRTPVEVDFIVTVPSAASVDLRTSGGDITVGDLEGGVRARTSGGGLALGKIGGDIDASTFGGGVALAEGRGSVKLSTSGGNISVGRAVGPSDLNTSGGDIRVDATENRLIARTSGGNVSAVFEGPLKGDSSLSTSGGEVKATVGRAAALRLDARTSGGEVDLDGVAIAVDGGGAGKSRLTGNVNGGGPLLNLRTSGGDIAVVAR